MGTVEDCAKVCLSDARCSYFGWGFDTHYNAYKCGTFSAKGCSKTHAYGTGDFNIYYTSKHYEVAGTGQCVRKSGPSPTTNSDIGKAFPSYGQISYNDKRYDTEEDCRKLCDSDNTCLGFSFKQSYTDCQVYKNIGGKFTSADLVGVRTRNSRLGHSDATCYRKAIAVTPTTYKHVAKGCVHGHNIILHKSKTVGQCEALCEAEPRCRAFEYGVAHGGPNMGYKPSDCQLQDSANTAGCRARTTTSICTSNPTPPRTL